jgi:hypothetical protein
MTFSGGVVPSRRIGIGSLRDLRNESDYVDQDGKSSEFYLVKNWRIESERKIFHF